MSVCGRQCGVCVGSREPVWRALCFHHHNAAVQGCRWSMMTPQLCCFGPCLQPHMTRMTDLIAFILHDSNWSISEDSHEIKSRVMLRFLTFKTPKRSYYCGQSIIQHRPHKGLQEGWPLPLPLKQTPHIWKRTLGHFLSR